jgi:hypothetical protein
MSDMERVYAFLVDLEELLKMRDAHFRAIRSIQMESDVITRSMLPQFEEQKEQALESNRITSMQHDESFRVCSGMLERLTHLDNIDDIRVRLTTLKAALSRFSEATHNTADSDILNSIVRDTDSDDYQLRLAALKESNEKDLEDLRAHIVNLVPASYSPHKAISNITLS